MTDPLIARFAAACGATGPLALRVGLADGGVLAEGSVAQPFTLVGRDESCDVTLSDPDVHPRHAWFQVVGGRVFALDLGSRSGLLWPGGGTGPGWLDVGVAVRVGPFRVQLRTPVAAPPVAPPPTANPLQSDPAVARGRPVHLDFRNGKRAKDRWAVNRAVTLVGRSEACKIHLHADDIARYHCGLVLTPSGLWVVDLSGRGVVVDGERMRVAALAHGTELKVGRFVMRCDDPPGAVPGSDTPPPAYSGDGPATRVTAVRPVAGEDEVSLGGLLRGDPAAGGLPSSHIMCDAFRAMYAGGPPSSPILVSGLSSAATGGPAARPGPPPAPPPPADGVIAPLLRHLGDIHGQMFEQVEQSLLLMVRLCGRGPEARAAELAAELDRIRELNRELGTLHTEVTQLALTHPPGTPPGGGDDSAVLGRTPLPRDGRLPPAAPADAGEAIHDWVRERIGALQRQRQSRWEALTGLLADG